MNPFQRGLPLNEDQTIGDVQGQDFQSHEIITLLQMGSPDKTLRFAQKHEAEIVSLQKQLNEKDEEIADLRQKLHAVQEKNNALQIKLKTKDDEVKQLQDRIQILEDEKKNLQDELSMVETKLKRLENDMKSLNKTTKLHEEENRKLKENLQKVEYDLHSTRDVLTSENEKLKKEVKTLKEMKVLPPPVDLSRALSSAQAPNEHSMALLHLGELCWQLQGSMYKEVLPNQYVPKMKYRIKNIEKDVKKLLTDEEKGQAEKRWQELKENIKWNDDLKETIGMLHDNRNVEAHPQITESSLKMYVQVLERSDSLKGWLSKERVNELIEIWKRLKQLKQQ